MRRIKDWLQSLATNRFWRSVLTLLSGSVLAQAIGLGALLVLAQVYPAEDFGIQAVFMAVILTLVIASNGGYEQAIMLPESEVEAKALFQLCQGINIGLVLLVGLLLWGIAPWLWAWLEADMLIDWHPLLLLSLGLEGSLQALRMMLNRQAAYRWLAISKVVQASVAAGLMLWLGWQGWGSSGLLIGWVAGSASSWVILAWGYWQRRSQVNVSRDLLRQVAQSYRDFPTRALWAGWLNAFSRQLPFYLLPGFFGQTVNGYYHMANRALMLPLSLISRSIGEVFFRQAASSKSAGEEALAQLTGQMARQLALLGLIPLILVMALGPWGFSFILGEEWEMAGAYARWLMPWIYLMFIASPLSYLLDIQRKLDFQLWYNVALFAVRLGALTIGGYILEATETIALYAGLGALMVGFHVQYLLRIAGVRFRT